VFYSLRRVPEIRQPAIAELGCLGLVFLCHLPKLACSLLVAGQACIACAHQSEVRALHDRCASRYLGVVGFFWLGTRKNPDLSVGGLNLCHFPCRLGSAGTGKSWLPDSNNRPAKRQIGGLAMKRRSARSCVKGNCPPVLRWLPKRCSFVPIAGSSRRGRAALRTVAPPIWKDRSAKPHSVSP
jgi:hypothetical protein